jgi:hypothetical protein
VGRVPYTNAQARSQLLDVIAGSIDQLGISLGMLEGAYELLDESSAETLESDLFRPVQRAYGRAKRTYAEFAERYELESRDFEQAPLGAPARGVKGLIDGAVSAASEADRQLAELQDSMLPVEVGDPELRAGLEQVRELVGGMPGRAREMLRTLGR